MWKKVVQVSRGTFSSCEYVKFFTSNTSEGSVAEGRKLPVASLLPTSSSNYNGQEEVRNTTDYKGDTKASTSSEVHLKLENSASSKKTEPAVSNRYEIYKYENQVKEAKTIGVGIGDVSIENFLIKHITMRSTAKDSLVDLNVALFNMHRTDIAERLIKLNVGGLSIIEASQYYAQQMKKFVKTQCWHKNRNVQAYRASFESLFPTGKKFGTRLPVKLLFGDKTLVVNGLNPLVLKRPSTANESGRKDRSSPLIVGILPVPLQQTQMVQVLLRTLIIHLCSYNKNTLFQYGPVEIITFLCPSNYASLICGANRKFTFVSNSHRYQSWFFNQLYDVKKLNPLEGFPCSSFSPPVPLQKNVSYEKKLSTLNIRNGYLYPVSIKPRTEVKIGTHTLVSNLDDTYDADSSFLVKPSEFLLQYSFWTQLIGKLTSRTRLLNRLIQWFPKLDAELKANVSSYGDVIDFDFAQLDTIFCIVREELCRHPLFSKELKMHSALYKIADDAKTDFAD